MQALEKMASPASNGTSLAHRFLWDVETYERACKMGVFEGRRVELIEGEINDLNAHSKPHMAAISRTYDLLREIFPKGSYVLTNQGTLYSSEQSRPEPDIAVFVATTRTFSVTIRCVPVGSRGVCANTLL